MGTTSYDLPMECPSNLVGAGAAKPCTGSNFIPQDGPGGAVYTNHQELRVQEQMQCLEPGSLPASMTVTVQDELADRCQPGGAVSAAAAALVVLSCRATAASSRVCRMGHRLAFTPCCCCNCCCCTDDVEVTGLVQAVWRPLFPGARCDGTLTLHACHLRTVNSMHRAVVPPSDGLAEQFRCGDCGRGLPAVCCPSPGETAES